MRRTLRVAALLSSALTLSCRFRPTQITLLMDSNADPSRRLELSFIALEGTHSIDEIRNAQGSIERLNNRSRALFPGSVSVIPKTGSARSGVVTLLAVLEAPEHDGSPAFRIERLQRASLIEQVPQQARIVFNLQCSTTTTGCSRVAPEQCTLSQRCIERGETCGDEGVCVSVDLPTVPVPPEVPLDATVDPPGRRDATADSDSPDSFDAVVPTDMQAPDAASTADAFDATSATDAFDAADARDATSGADAFDATSGADARDVVDVTDARDVIDVTDARDVVDVTMSCSMTTSHMVGGACVANGGVRPILPMSLGDTTLRRPTLRFALPSGADGAVIEICRDRACTSIIETLRVTGTTARPTAALPASTVVFWRARARVGAVEDTIANNGPTWLFHTPARDNTGAIDTSYNPHLDVNGDGFDDVAVGTYTARVAVFHGSATGVSAAPALTLSGGIAGSRHPASIARAGDVNGDGFGDLVVGSPGAAPGGRSFAGSATVFVGGPLGITDVGARTMDGATAGAEFGTSVACAGDVNSDGFADIIVGAPLARTNGGEASVFHGSAAGVALTSSATLLGPANSLFGRSVASAGDVNGDGFTDVVVGAPEAASGVFFPGIVRTYHGSASGVTNSPNRTLTGPLSTSGELGASVASAGDVDGDGYADIIAGAPQSSPSGLAGAGMVIVGQGSATGITATYQAISGVATIDFLGNAVASAGDVNRDGYSDVLFAAFQADPGGRQDAGLVRVHFGSASGLPGTASQTLEGPTAMIEFGQAVTGACDVNGDGFSDVVVGAPQASPGGRGSAGTASVFHGSAMGLPLAPTRTLDGTAASDLFGFYLASAQTAVERAPQRTPVLSPTITAFEPPSTAQNRASFPRSNSAVLAAHPRTTARGDDRCRAHPR
ncbi:MAG: FG-GAP-like repeat-containing protein [Polyangiales bacterium]